MKLTLCEKYLSTFHYKVFSWGPISFFFFFFFFLGLRREIYFLSVFFVCFGRIQIKQEMYLQECLTAFDTWIINVVFTLYSILYILITITKVFNWFIFIDQLIIIQIINYSEKVGCLTEIRVGFFFTVLRYIFQKVI